MTFGLYGENSKIEFELKEIWGFPDTTSYSGGYDGKWMVRIKSGNYSCEGIGYFSTGEFYLLGEEIKKIYEKIEGQITVDFFETDMKMNIDSNNRGQIVITGHYQSEPCLNNRLEFEFNSDQTYLIKTIEQLNELREKYGEMKGKK